MTNGNGKKTTVVGAILEEEVVLSLGELCRASRLSAERVIELVDEGVVEPAGRTPETWRFHGHNLWRVRCAMRLEQDLGINTPGVALVLDLLEEMEQLRARLARLAAREAGTD